MRTGIIAKKIGMTRIYLSDGTHVPVTVLSVDECQVVASKNDKNLQKYSLTLGVGKAKIKNVSKPLRESFAKIKIEPKRKLVEFKVSKDNMIEIGKEIGTNHFVVGQYVDATGISIGKGFAGSMKRHNFAGLRASHGVSISHRSHGSTGNSQDPGRVFKGKKMAGHMGSSRATIQNLQVVATDEERGLIFIKGGVPGADGSWLALKDAIKKALPSNAPFPAGIKGVTKQPDTSDKKPVEEVATEEKSTEEAKAEAKVVEESKVAEKPAEEAKAEEKPAEEAKAEAKVAKETEEKLKGQSTEKNKSEDEDKK